MTVNLIGPGFEAVMRGAPQDVHVPITAFGFLGYSFSDFAFDRPGAAKVSVSGVQLGACREPRGVSIETSEGVRDVTAEAIIVRPPGRVTESTWTHGFRGQYLALAPETIERFFHEPLHRLSFCTESEIAPVAERQVLSYLLSSISTELVAGNPNGSPLVESLVASALHLVVRPQVEARVQRGLSNKQSRRVREMIIDRSSEPVSLAEIAAAADLSVGHMLRSFKQTFGVTPHQFLIRERVEQAVVMLTTTSQALDTIAEACGFGTRAQMTRSFRTQLGTSPTTVRAQKI